jgi:hypothetical protein
MEDPHVKAGEVVIRKTPRSRYNPQGPIHQELARAILLHRSVKASSASTRSRNQTAARPWFPLQTLPTSHRQLFFRPAPIFDVAPVPHPFSFLAHAVLHAHLAVPPHTCIPTSPLPYALADNDRFSLRGSDLFSLGSRPDRPAHCRHLTIRTGDQPAPRLGRQNATGYRSYPCEPASLLPARNIIQHMATVTGSYAAH